MEKKVREFISDEGGLKGNAISWFVDRNVALSALKLNLWVTDDVLGLELVLFIFFVFLLLFLSLLAGFEVLFFFSLSMQNPTRLKRT